MTTRGGSRQSGGRGHKLNWYAVGIAHSLLAIGHAPPPKKIFGILDLLKVILRPSECFPMPLYHAQIIPSEPRDLPYGLINSHRQAFVGVQAVLQEAALANKAQKCFARPV